MLVVTFYTTSAAMAAEKLCRAQHMEGRLLPAPRSITSDCGICWCAPPQSREALEALFTGAALAVDGYHLCFL